MRLKVSGYTYIVIIFLLVFATAVAFVSPGEFLPGRPDTYQHTCMYDPPLREDSFSMDGETFDLLSPARPIQEDFAVGLQNRSQSPRGHLKLIGENLVGETPRDVYIPFDDLTEVGSPQSPTWKGGGANNAGNPFDLRFVDVTDDIPYPQAGFRYFSVYLKRDVPIPGFIRTYCENENFPKEPLVIFQDTFGNSFPPYSIPGKNFGFPPCPNANCGREQVYRFYADTNYYLFAYDSEGTSSYDFFSLPQKGEVTIGGKKYPMFLNSDSDIAYINVLDTSTTPQRSYKYVSEKFMHTNLQTLGLRESATGSAKRDMVQLDDMYPFFIEPWGWWTPECKPAIYLYPEKDTVVNVKVAITDGFLTYTDPVYPKAGWSVLAKPHGDLHSLSAHLADSKGRVNYPTGVFPYLYYEGKIEDSAIAPSDTGFVKSYDDLSSFFDVLLPRLGLNAKETIEFKDYWLKALPKTSYYFIGIIPQSQLDKVEPLTVTPKEDTMIRVRLHFEALDAPKTVVEPDITTPVRNGFTVVDWGGMVKADKEHPFTCVQ